MKKEKKKRSTALKIFLGFVGVLLLAILLLIVWAAWGKNLGEQVKHQSFAVTDETVQNGSAVYFTSDISPEGMLAVYDALGIEATGNVAVKLSTGEAGGEYYLSPDLIADLVHKVGGTIVECNTAYGGSRGSTAVHMQTAADHGFTAITDVDIMDSEGQMSIPVANGKHLTEDGASLEERIESRNGLLTLKHAEEIGLGSRTYYIVNIDGEETK